MSLLERLVTHSTSDWDEGELRFGALLTPQGKVLVDFLSLRTATGVLMEMHKDALTILQPRLKLYKLRADVEIAPVTDQALFLCSAEGGGAPDPRSPLLPHRTLAPFTVDAGNATAAYETQSIAAGIPEWGRDYRDGEVFPTDVNMDRMHGVDYKKGCFVGQEVASRMYRRGKIRKRTIRLEGAGLAVGEAVKLGDTPLGEVTSASGDIALARVRIDRLGHAKEVDVGGKPTRVTGPDWLTGEVEALLVSD